MAGHPGTWDMPEDRYVVCCTESGSHWDISVTYVSHGRVLLNSIHTYTDYGRFRRLRGRFEVMVGVPQLALSGSVKCFLVPPCLI